MQHKLYKDLFYSSFRIRRVEEKIVELYPTDVIQSPVHLSIGQEAVATGICFNLNISDMVFINYRGHAYYLAKGGPLPEFFAELMGRGTGICKGKGGSMHLADPLNGTMGASAVVASTISHAVGAALAEKIKNEGKIFIAVFGDGAVEQGVLHECLNFASLHSLPVLFLCEDNGLAVHAKSHERRSFCFEKLVNAYSIDYYQLNNGYDLIENYNFSKNIIDLVRSKCKPAFARIMTSRYKEHVGPGEDFSFGYRDKKDINEWIKKDPLCQDTQSIKEIVNIIDTEINEALDFANNSPMTDSSELFTDVI